jgi:hypothetical protein
VLKKVLNAAFVSAEFVVNGMERLISGSSEVGSERGESVRNAPDESIEQLIGIQRDEAAHGDERIAQGTGYSIGISAGALHDNVRRGAYALFCGRQSDVDIRVGKGVNDIGIIHDCLISYCGER